MFTKPIKWTRLNSMEELLRLSFLTGQTAKQKLVYEQKDGQIAFSDEDCRVWVTPYRAEICDILVNADYEMGSTMVPFLEVVQKKSYAYNCLKQIAERERWAETHEKAWRFSQEKGIKPVEFDKEIQMRIQEITTCFDWFVDDKHSCKPMITPPLLEESQSNIGTYIIIDDKSILVCDEYGRTYCITVKASINDVVNALIDAGYTHAAHPEKYVRKKCS